jgi:signal transduction histidine kinase
MLAAGTLLIVVLSGLLVPLALSAGHHTFDEARNEEITAASVLSGQISDPVARAAEVVSEAPHPGQSLAAAVRAVVGATRMRVLVVDRHRRVLADSTGKISLGQNLTGRAAGIQEVLAQNGSPRPVAHSVANELVVTVPVLEAGRLVGAVQVARPMSAVHTQTVHRDLALAGLGLAALVFGIAVAALLATRVTRPVRRLGNVARQFGAGELDARAEPEQVRELTELAGSFNAMADALAANVRAQQEFAANASHQLKTPLTALQLRLEAIAAADAADIDAPAEARKALAEVARLSALTDDLMQLARASAPVDAGEIVELGALAGVVVDRWAETAARRQKQLSLTVSGAAEVRADPEDLEQLLDNLIDNAVRYSGNGTRIVVGVEGGVVSVSDDGPGIPEDEHDRVLERFYRGRQGRAVGPGTGLGLAVVVALAARWAGTVQLVPGAGTRIDVRFPIARAGGAGTHQRGLSERSITSPSEAIRTGKTG